MEHIVTTEMQLTAAHFTADYWHQQNAVVGTSGGRNTVWFIAPNQGINTAGEQWVLRHYYRGGLPGNFIRRSFIYTGLKRTRAVAEFELLQKMHTSGLPVPKPVAAYVQRSGITYRASLLIERIIGSQDLGRLLLEQKLTTTQWQRVGTTIKRFHQAGVYHSDLNCKNILWREHDESVFVIDFDRCFYHKEKERQSGTQQVVQKSWQAKNLSRLLRSFEKELNLATRHSPAVNFHWTPADWLALMDGYNGKV